MEPLNKKSKFNKKVPVPLQNLVSVGSLNSDRQLIDSSQSPRVEPSSLADNVPKLSMFELESYPETGQDK